MQNIMRAEFKCLFRCLASYVRKGGCNAEVIQ